MTQPTLFDDPCASRHGGNPQSVAALPSQEARETWCSLLLADIAAAQNGLTLDELCAAWSKTPNQISGRITTLKAQGRIRQHGTRPTRSGRPAAVYVAVYVAVEKE